MQLIDTHCHIHSKEYKEANPSYQHALENGVEKMICVGTDPKDAVLAVEFAQHNKQAFAAIGVHPHEAQYGIGALPELIGRDKVVAIGEIGLDYFYSHSDKGSQQAILEEQLQLAVEAKLPVIFHVREAFDDFWPIFHNFRSITGVLHSFTDSNTNAEKALQEGLFIGVNGISTFTKDAQQKELFRTLPLNRIVLETDAPYLTPAPWRGKVNEPAFVKRVAEHLSTERSTTVEEIATQTTHNATHLFHI